jgi:hypothetical protein
MIELTRILFLGCSKILVAVKRSSGNDGLSLIVRKVYTMANTRPTKTKSESGSPVGTSGDSTKSRQKGNTARAGSRNSHETTNATTLRDSVKTWTSAELEELVSKASLVAGALADFQAAGGLVAVKNIEYKSPSGSTFTATKLYLVAEGVNLKVYKTADGLDFDITGA